MTIAWIYLDKKTAAVDALKDYDSMDYIIQNHRDDLEEARSKMTAPPSASVARLSKQMNPQSGEARLAASLDEIDVLKERYRRALEYMEWFAPAWDALTEDERFILTEYFLRDDYKTSAIASICERFSVERSAAYKKKDAALTRLTLLLYGK